MATPISKLKNLKQMSRQTTSISDYSQAISSILACVRQDKVLIPNDLTVDNDTYIPVRVNTYKQQTTNLDFNDIGKSPTYTMLVARGYKIDAVYARFMLPAQYSKSKLDAICYDSIPGINILASFQTSLSTGFAFESINALAIRERLIDYYGIKNFKKIAIEWLGGYRDSSYTHPNQVLRKAQKSTSAGSKNVIFPAIKITLPLPSCLFFNKEKFCFSLSMETALEFKFTFNPITRVLNTSRDYSPDPLTGTIEIYMRMLNPTEYGNFWTGLSYTRPDTTDTYYFVDGYLETTSKTYNVSQELKLQVKPAPTKKIHGFICPRHWSVNDLYFGVTVAEAARNYLASMITHTTKNTNSFFTLDLGTGLFLNGQANVGSISVAGWSATSNSFNLVLQRNATSVSTVKINCSMNLGDIGHLYLDLATFAPGSNPNAASVLDVFQVASIFFLGSIKLVIEPFDNLRHIEYPEYAYDTAVKLENGLFSYKNGTNTLALVDIVDITPSSLLSPADFAFDFIFSYRVPQQNSANVLIMHDFKHVNKTNHIYYDLDGKWPIRVDSIAYEKTTSNTEVVPSDELSLQKDLFEEQHFWSPSVEVVYEYKDFRDINKQTNGFLDLRTYDILFVTFKLLTEKIMYGELEVMDSLKEYNSKGWEVEVILLQFALRILKYSEGSIDIMTDEERLSTNNYVMQSVLLPNGLYEASAMDEQNVQAVASKRSHPSYNQGGSRDSSPGRHSVRPTINSLKSISKRPRYY